jgi:hypothetical protein
LLISAQFRPTELKQLLGENKIATASN